MLSSLSSWGCGLSALSGTGSQGAQYSSVQVLWSPKEAVDEGPCSDALGRSPCSHSASASVLTAQDPAWQPNSLSFLFCDPSWGGEKPRLDSNRVGLTSVGIALDCFEWEASKHCSELTEIDLGYLLPLHRMGDGVSPFLGPLGLRLRPLGGRQCQSIAGTTILETVNTSECPDQAHQEREMEGLISSHWHICRPLRWCWDPVLPGSLYLMPRFPRRWPLTGGCLLHSGPMEDQGHPQPRGHHLSFSFLWWARDFRNNMNSFCCCLVAKSCLTLLSLWWTAAHQVPPSMGFSRWE